MRAPRVWHPDSRANAARAGGRGGPRPRGPAATAAAGPGSNRGPAPPVTAAAKPAQEPEKLRVGGQHPDGHGSDTGSGRAPAGSMTPSPSPQPATTAPPVNPMASWPWRAGHPAPEHRGQRGSCLFHLSPRTPAATTRPPAWNRPGRRLGRRPGSHVRIPGFSDGGYQQRKDRFEKIFGR
jgi:hypothetical protein